MTRLSRARSAPAVRRRAAKLAAVAAGLVALAAFAPVSANAANGLSANSAARPAVQQCGGRWHPRPCEVADPVVNFRRNALFSCFFGAVGGIPTANTANITATFFTVTATVTVFGTPGTTVFGQLVQGACARLRFFTVTVGPTGVGTTTVTDFRVSNTVFLWFNSNAGDFEITPRVSVF
jgi:hypothetical protein